MTNTKSLLARLSGGLSMAALALAISFGSSSAVRAEDGEVLSPSLQDMVIVPIMRAVAKVDQRLASLEAAAGAWADSFSTRNMVAQRLCISDESGAQTCVSKAQLDALLRVVAHADTTDIPDAAPVETQITAIAPEETAPGADQMIGEVPSQGAASEATAAVSPDAGQSDPSAEATGTVTPTQPGAPEDQQDTSAPVDPQAGAAPDQSEPVTTEEPAGTNDLPQIEQQPDPSESAAEPAAATELPQAGPVTEETEVTPPVTPDAIEAPQTDPAQTGSITPTDRGAALIFHPEVEISIVATNFDCD